MPLPPFQVWFCRRRGFKNLYKTDGNAPTPQGATTRRPERGWILTKPTADVEVRHYARIRFMLCITSRNNTEVVPYVCRGDSRIARTRSRFSRIQRQNANLVGENCVRPQADAENSLSHGFAVPASSQRVRTDSEPGFSLRMVRHALHRFRGRGSPPLRAHSIHFV